MAKFLKGFKSFQDLENLFGAAGKGNMGGKYFGKPLDSTDVESIPKFLFQVMDVLKDNHIKKQGLFRRNGSKELIDEVTEILDDAEEEDLEVSEIVEALENDPHSMAGLLKLYFRQMPEPLLTFELYDQWIECVQGNDKEAIKKKIKVLLSKIDQTSKFLMKRLFYFLYQVGRFSKFNLMTPENLSLVFAPNLLRPKVLDLTTFKDAGSICKLVKFMIEDPEEYFGK